MLIVLKQRLALIIICSVFGVCFSANTAASELIRIMPLGDSITKGTGSINDNSYRKPLYLNLLNAGYKVDCVGSQMDGDFADPDHEGHNGWHAAGGTDGGIAPNVYNWLVANPADIVLLHIGTNDITSGDQDPNEISEILDEIDRYSEDITVILALIINRQNYSLETTEYNNDVKNMALGRIAAGDDIIIVDMENALNYSTDMSDETHPNDDGYTKMADVWYEALAGFLNKDCLEERNQRLELITSGKLGNFVDHYIANGWRIDTNENFAVKTDFHYSNISSRPGWIGINIADEINYVSISVGSDSNAIYFYYETIIDGNMVLEQELSDANDGTLYVSYDANSNEVYLSHVGYGSVNAYNWSTIANPLQSQWLSSVDIAIGGGSDYVYLRKGDAYLENFEVSDAELLDWPPPTDLDHNGYIELWDLAELCEHWLGTDVGDIDNSGSVDFRDFAELCLAW